MPTPRRCAKRWLDEDCPCGVLCILGHKKHGTVDVIYRQVHDYGDDGQYLIGRELSDDPFHPQVVGMSFEMKLHEVAAYRKRMKYMKWSELTPQQKKCVRQDLKGDN